MGPEEDPCGVRPTPGKKKMEVAQARAKVVVSLAGWRSMGEVLYTGPIRRNEPTRSVERARRFLFHSRAKIPGRGRRCFGLVQTSVSSEASRGSHANWDSRDGPAGHSRFITSSIHAFAPPPSLASHYFE